MSGVASVRMSKVGRMPACPRWGALLPRFYDITGGSSDIIHLYTSSSTCPSIPCQSVVLFYSNPFEYAALGVGREARHRKQTGNGKIINDAKRLYIYINTRSFSMSLRAQAIDSPSTFLRDRLCGPVADAQFSCKACAESGGTARAHFP